MSTLPDLLKTMVEMDGSDLHIATNTPHLPFFTRFFQVMTETTKEKQDEIHNALVRFLQSPSVNERTDDDKTLALAVIV